MTEEQRIKYEARLKLTQRIGHTRFEERKRIGDRIEQMLFETQSDEVAEALVSLAQHVFEGGRA